MVDVDGRVKSNQSGDTHVIVFYDKAVVPVAVMRPVSDLVGSQYPRVSTPTKVDELVVAKLRKLGIVPSHDADDLTFLRRLSLDMTGTLPSPEEIREFLADASPDKRMAKIEAFLETPAFAAWWTTKLCDWTGNNGSQLANVAVDQNATRDWYDWIYERVNRNAPYDEIVEGIVCIICAILQSMDHTISLGQGCTRSACGHVVPNTPHCLHYGFPGDFDMRGLLLPVEVSILYASYY
jgi:hypothetical protein